MEFNATGKDLSVPLENVRVDLGTERSIGEGVRVGVRREKDTVLVRIQAPSGVDILPAVMFNASPAESTGDFMRSELRKMTAPAPELEIAPEMVTAIRGAEQVIGFYDSKGLASVMKGGVTADNIEKARRVITQWLLQGLVEGKKGAEITELGLKTAVETLVRAGSPDKEQVSFSFQKSPTIYSHLGFLDAKAWGMLTEHFPVVLGTLMRLGGSLVIFVNADVVDPVQAQKALYLLAQKHGIALDEGKLQVKAADKSQLGKIQKADAFQAMGSEIHGKVGYRPNIRSHWTIDKPNDMLDLASGIATMLLASLDEKLSHLPGKFYSPRNYSEKLFAVVLGALQAYESIKQAA